MRLSYSGSTDASQASRSGSIPDSRSLFLIFNYYEKIFSLSSLINL